MTQLDQSSATVNGKTPKVSAPESDTTRPAHAGPLLAAGLLAALVIGAGAYVYYQNEREVDTAVSIPQPGMTSDNTASAPAESAPLSTESTASSAQSTKPLPQDESRVRDIANAAPPSARSAKTRHIANASKSAAALEPRDRQVALATPPKPTYPVQALRAHEQGTVLVLAQVNVDGQVTDARVVGRSGSTTLDRAAPNEVRQWKFEPALHNGRPVVASIEVPVNYRLNQ
jgi:TonB family protein